MGNRPASVNVALFLLLAALSFFSPATATTPGFAFTSTGTAVQLPEESHLPPVQQATLVGNRSLRHVPPGPSHIPAALTFAVVLAAAALLPRPVRGRILNRGPDSPGRSRLAEIGVDRR